MPTDRTDLLQGTLELLILNTLARESMHGYGIVQRIHEAAEDLLKVEDGSLTRRFTAWKNVGGSSRNGECRKTTGERSSINSRARANDSSKLNAPTGTASLQRLPESCRRHNP